VLSHEPRPGQKIKVAILFGGKSVEHEVSIRSAKNIIHAIDKKIYDIVLIGIDKQGRWLSAEKSATLLNDGKINTSLETEKMILTSQGDGKIIATNGSNVIHDVDVVFPVLHGPFGEDGTVQGLLKLANIPFVGAAVLFFFRPLIGKFILLLDRLFCKVLSFGLVFYCSYTSFTLNKTNLSS
jgi:D-alanine-D-alanine ligase